MYLHVRGRRPDGYHELDSLVVFPEFGDEVSLRPAKALELVVEGPFAGALADTPPEKNLAMRAAALLLHEADGAPEFEIRLRKNVPLGAGLGGGSADAAAVLLLLNERLGLQLDRAELRGLGLRLGADVPACLESASVFFGGVGEIIDPAPALPRMHLVLVWPGRALATAEVFRAKSSRTTAARPAVAGLTLEQLIDVLRPTTNDLQAAARTLLPAIGDALDALGATRECLLVRMTGSGSACFGICATEAQAHAAAATVRAAHPTWWTTAVAT